jgi:hypothetical protein
MLSSAEIFPPYTAILYTQSLDLVIGLRTEQHATVPLRSAPAQIGGRACTM